jgi:hypothetical protein
MNIAMKALLLGLCAASLHANAEELTIGTVIGHMTASANEAIPKEPDFDWQHYPKIVMYSPTKESLPSWWTGTKPDWCYKLLTWYTAFEAEGNTATNTRVQVANLRVYILSDKTRTWSLIQNVASPFGGLWKQPFKDMGGPVDTRPESSGGNSVYFVHPYFAHGYGKNYTLTAPDDIRAVFVAMDFKLVVNEADKPDDRDDARYVVNAGADYYPGNGVSWGTGYAPGIGSGRYLLATNNWRTATMLVPNTASYMGSSFAEMSMNPPPLTGTYQ